MRTTIVVSLALFAMTFAGGCDEDVLPDNKRPRYVQMEAPPPPSIQPPAPAPPPDGAAPPSPAPPAPNEPAPEAPLAPAPVGPPGHANAPPRAPDPFEPATGPAPNIPPAAAPAKLVDADREKAQAGVGAKGRDYGGGYVTSVIHAKFTAEQRIVFEIQLPKAMQFFKAEHNRPPKTHDEFMRDVIQANQIVLPELPLGDKYVYDPEKEELMVEHKR